MTGGIQITAPLQCDMSELKADYPSGPQGPEFRSKWPYQPSPRQFQFLTCNWLRYRSHLGRICILTELWAASATAHHHPNAPLRLGDTLSCSGDTADRALALSSLSSDCLVALLRLHATDSALTSLNRPLFTIPSSPGRCMQADSSLKSHNLGNQPGTDLCCPTQSLWADINRYSEHAAI